MNNSYGQSGARLTKVAPNLVLKRGNERVGRQGRWLREQRNNVALPQVYAAGKSWYVMESLSEVDNEEITPWIVGYLLVNRVWTEAGDTVSSPELHAEYIKRKLNVTGITASHEFTRRHEFVVNHWGRLTLTRSHGDTTASNVMKRKTGEQVLIDPVPSRVVGYVFPDSPSVDIGKMLQSALGYERKRFNRPITWTVSEVLNVLRDLGVQPYDVEAGKYFCAAHILAAIPYTPDEHKAMMTDLFKEASEL